jgi:hypothetical protein
MVSIHDWKDTVQRLRGLKEDHVVSSTIVIGGESAANIPCRVYLPESPRSRPELLLEPTKEQYELLARVGFARLRGERSVGNYVLEIDAPTIYVVNALDDSRGAHPYYVHAEAEDLRVTERSSPSQEGSEDIEVAFWISDNRTLGPNAVFTHNRDGTIERSGGRPRTITLDGGTCVTFDRHYRSQVSANGDEVRRSISVATSNMSGRCDDVDRLQCDILQLIDDLLLLASLGLRQRVVCIGWLAVGGRTTTTFFRGNIAVPDANHADQFQLVQKDYDSFLQRAVQDFSKRPNAKAIRSVIYALARHSSTHVEEDFVSMFAALEELLLEYRNRHQMGSILDLAAWKTARTAIKQSIKALASLIPEERRGWMYVKIEELNRVPLRIVFERYISVLAVDLGDLWPVFDGAGALYQVRNRLVHGELITREELNALATATRHLRWVLERILLSELGWSVDQSNACRGFILHYPLAIREFSGARSTFFAKKPQEVPSTDSECV